MALALALLCRRVDPRIPLLGAVAFGIYIGLDDLATTLPRLFPIFSPVEMRWNWAGKVYSVLLSGGVIMALRLKPADVGLVARQRNLRSSLVATAVLIALSCALGFIFRPPVPSAETIAFQMTMPGLAEELAYRGVAPALLLGLWAGAKMPAGIPWAVVFATGAVFGIWHGLDFTDSRPSFDLLSASFPFIGGIAYGWLRFHSGSILLPIVAHAAGNTIFYAASIL